MSFGHYHLKPDVNTLSQISVVVMPAASNLVGGVKQGAGIAIASDGTISTSGSAISVDGVLVGNVTNAPISVDGIGV